MYSRTCCSLFYSEFGPGPGVLSGCDLQVFPLQSSVEDAVYMSRSRCSVQLCSPGVFSLQSSVDYAVYMSRSSFSLQLCSPGVLVWSGR